MIRWGYICALGLVGVITVVILLGNFLPDFDTKMEKKSSKPGKVIVVGGGLAGLSATIEASRHGAHVTIIDKEKNLGGNSAKATSGINGVGTQAQTLAGITDSVETFTKDTISSGDGLSVPSLVQHLATNSAAAIDFLMSFGLNLTSVVQLGGHSAARTHRIPPTPEGKPIPVGFTILSTLKKYVENELKDSVIVLTKSHFQGLFIVGDEVKGIYYADESGSVNKLEGTVILSGGGFANDHTDTSLLDKYTPELSKYPTTNGPWATGDIIKAVEKHDMSLVHMDKVQIHPTGFVEPKQPKFHTKFLAPEALRGCGAVLLNQEGKRFANELGRRDYVTKNILENCKPYQNEDGNPIVAAMLLNQEVIDKFGAPAAGFYKLKGLVTEIGDYTKVAETLGVDPNVVKQTIADYAAAAASKGSDEFGKTVFPTVFSETDTFFVAFITPTLHYCMGGLQINVKAEALFKLPSGADGFNLRPRPGLYAAGEVSGGVHGNNRLGGNSLLECVVFGRTAGYHAAHYHS